MVSPWRRSGRVALGAASSRRTCGATGRGSFYDLSLTPAMLDDLYPACGPSRPVCRRIRAPGGLGRHVAA
ncbi:hypothetical protein QJS66_16135 [Kocuria rhizophila]|nr:hypothetical protein QJS66_16135 [Kocuria rhizophila]